MRNSLVELWRQTALHRDTIPPITWPKGGNFLLPQSVPCAGSCMAYAELTCQWELAYRRHTWRLCPSGRTKARYWDRCRYTCPLLVIVSYINESSLFTVLGGIVWLYKSERVDGAVFISTSQWLGQHDWYQVLCFSIFSTRALWCSPLEIRSYWGGELFRSSRSWSVITST